VLQSRVCRSRTLAVACALSRVPRLPATPAGNRPAGARSRRGVSHVALRVYLIPGPADRVVRAPTPVRRGRAAGCRTSLGETVLRSDDESSSIPFRGKIASKAAVFSYALRVSFSGDQETCLRSMVSTASSAAYGYNFASRFKQRQLMPRFSADPSEVAFLQRRQQHAFLQLLIHSPVWDRRGGGQGLRPCSTGTCSLPQTKSPPERCSMDRPKN
jgi:hypothetical protein